MAHRDLHSGARLASLELLCLAGLLAGVAGCGAREPVRATASVVESISGGLDTDVLRIATTWPRPEQEQLEQEFRDKTSGAVPVRLVWVELSPGTRLDNFGTHALPVDVLLGGPLTEYVRLSRAGRLEPLDGQGAPYWFVARRRQIVLSDGFSPGHEQIAFDDPRVDPPTMTWAAGQLRQGFVASRLCPAGPAFFPFVPSSRLAERLGRGRREPWRGRAYAPRCRPVRFRK